MTTSKQGFTKGPWNVGHVPDGSSEVYSPNQVYDANGDAICSVYGIHLHRTLGEIDKDPRCAEGLAHAKLIASAPELYEALAELLKHADRNECHHVTTHRAGAIWTICDDCGRKWADDEGGFVPYVEPEHIAIARAALARAAGEGE